MSCIASILALYVPYDFNFHEGMTSLESYGLRYVTPLVALIVVPIAARVRSVILVIYCLGYQSSCLHVQTPSYQVLAWCLDDHSDHVHHGC